MFSFFGGLFYFCVSLMWMCLCDELDDDQQKLIINSIPEMYLEYRKALESSDENTVVFRRVLRNNKQYNIHLNKLKDVNGFKKHNLIVKEESDDNPLIYINNPVETKIPNAYLSLEGFKELLTGRVLRQRNEFQQQNYKTMTTFKPVHWLTVKRNSTVHFTQFKKKNTRFKFRNISTTKKAKKKVIAMTKKITLNKIHINSTAKQTTLAAIVSTVVIEKTSTKAPILREINTKESVLDTVITTNLPNKINSTQHVPNMNIPDSRSYSLKKIETLFIAEHFTNNATNILSTTESTSKVNTMLLHTLRINSKKDIENTKTNNNDKVVTNVLNTTENTLKTEATVDHTLRIHSKVVIKNKGTDEIDKNVTNDFTVTINTLSTDAMTETKNVQSQETKENTITENNTPSTDILNFEEKTTTESTIKESSPTKHAGIFLNFETSANKKTNTDNTATTTAESIIEEVSISSKEYNTEESNTEESYAEKSNTEELNNEKTTVASDTKEFNNDESNFQESTTQKTTIEKLTPKRQTTKNTKRPTTTQTTTKKATKKTTLGKPLVYMGGWDNTK